MRSLSYIALAFAMSWTGCSAKQNREAVLLSEEEPAITEPQPAEPAAPDPTPDEGRRADGPIDLGIEGEYGNLEVEDTRPKPTGRRFSKPRDAQGDWSCKVATDCEGRGLSRPKSPGRWLCEQNQCVFARTEPNVEMF